MKKYLFSSAIIFVVCHLHAQVLINEAASSNIAQFADESNEYPDWIELINSGTSTVNIAAWGITDNATIWNKWLLPDKNLAPGERLIVFASGLDLNGYNAPNGPTTNHWETVMNDNSTWQYHIGDTSPDANWNSDITNSEAWTNAPGGFGYGDGDDNTVIPDGTVSVYFRRTFVISNLADVTEAMMSIDYDDAFIAYINGVEVARNGIGGSPDNFTLADFDHEAAMYGGGDPESFYIDQVLLNSILVQGTNVFAIEIHNIANNSSDLTGRAWLHAGIGSAATYFFSNPSWFVPPVNGGTGTNLHTNFKVSFNETISLYNAAGLIQDNVIMNVQAGHARARIPDAGVWCYTDVPTPDAPNFGTCYTGYASQPTINQAGGFYTNSVTVSMTGTGIRYTTDGDIPTTTDPFYISPITLTSTDIVRARSFQAGKLPSAVVSRTFFINDPTTLPVVSIIAHSGDLFNDGTGGPAVYDNSYGFTQAGTTGCTVQYYNAAHQFQFESAASLTPVGNFSLDFAQKSMQFKYDEEYGATGDVAYNIFSYDKPSLGPSHGFRVRSTDDDYYNARMRDLVSNRMAIGTYSGTAAYQNVAVFINGEYWGHYGAREMLNDYFMRDNYGVSTDNVDMVKTAFPGQDYVAEEGTTDGFFAMSDFIINNDMSDPTNFAQAETLIDKENWVDYFANEIYNNNQDWFPSFYFNNTRLANSVLDNCKWKYILWDVGYSQGVIGSVYDDLLSNTLSFPSYQNLHTDMMASLLTNADFRNYFINRFADLLNFKWTTTKTHALIDQCAAEMTPEINRQNDRWGSGDLGYWQSQVDYLKDFHTVRPDVQRQHIEDYFGMTSQVDITLNVLPAGAGVVKISTVIPDSYPWTGVYYNGNPVKVTAIPNPGYSFVNWSANAFISNTNQSTFTTNISTNTTFTANFTGSPVAVNIKVTEINYNSDSTRSMGDWIEIYNNGTTTIDLSDWKLQDQNFFNFWYIPTGTTLAPQQYLVLASNLENFSAEHPLVTNVVGEFPFELSNSGETFYLFNRNNGLVAQVTYDDTPVWPCTADGHGRTLELTSLNANPLLPSSWFDGCMGGSPGTSYSPCNEDPVISEINYKSSLAQNAGDWIEWHNKSSSSVYIGGWKISDKTGNTYTIPLGTVLQGNSYLVFYQDLNLFTTQFPAITNLMGPMNFGFNGDGDVIRILDGNGRLFQSVCFNDTPPWPAEADGGGYTLELENENGNLNDGNNWFAGCPEGSPGTAYIPGCQVCTVFGCNDPTACNYINSSVCDDGSCTYPGCTDVNACNYAPSAGCNNGSCIPKGCTDTQACNYSSTAGCDDGTCAYITHYLDADGDGYGNSSVTGQYCNFPPGNYVLNNTDCDDSNPNKYPGAAPTGQGVDNNCNGILEPYELFSCPGDFNNDGFINIADLLTFIANMGCVGVCVGDLDNSGGVGTSDLLFFISVFGTTCP
jgi:hypothetical protein